MTRKSEELSMPGAAVQVLRFVGDIASRRARGLATADQVASARSLLRDTLKMLTTFHDLARRFLAEDELSDLTKVERLCRSYELVLWETGRAFCRN